MTGKYSWGRSGKIERYHRSMKNVVKLQNYYSPSELEQSIAEFVECYNNQRYHESINNLTPADVYSGKSEEVLTIREQIKVSFGAIKASIVEVFSLSPHVRSSKKEIYTTVLGIVFGMDGII